MVGLSEIKENLKPGLVLFIICLASAFSLSVVHSLTEEKIAKVEEEQANRALMDIFPTSELIEEDGYWRAEDEGETVGYASVVKSSGYGGEMRVALGIYPNETIKGVRVISHKETPGIGSKATKMSFLKQFSGLDSGDLKLENENGEIDAVSGATISSQAVTDAVKKGLKNILER